MKTPQRLLVSLLQSALLCSFVPPLSAQSLSKSFEIDFGREVLSRDLKGLAARSDGRVLPGPTFTDLEGPRIADILWCLKPAGDNRFLVGTGPEGDVHEVMFDPATNTYTTRSILDVAETQAMAVLPLPDGGALVGTSPTAALYIARDGQAVARVPLPADSVFDFLALSDGTVLAATGNPGRIYRIDPAVLAKAGITEGRTMDEKTLASHGVSQFGEVRDRNVRRLIRLADGRIVAGSAPKGTIYVFDASGGAPVILHEQRDAEVVDLMADPRGDIYAVFVTNPPGPDSRPQRFTALTPPPAPEATKDSSVQSFAGRSMIVRIPFDGFPETVAMRTNIAIYRAARHGEWLILAAGEQGDAFGYDPEARRSLVFAGSSSAQLNDVAPLGDGRYLVLRNNAPGLALMSFAQSGDRALETKRIDLGQHTEIGNLRFDRMRGVTADALKVEVRTNNGSDEIEGWSDWRAMERRDGAFYAAGLRGRYLKLRVRIGNAPEDFQIDKAMLFHLPQNRRPQLADFRIFPPNLGLLPQPDVQPQSAVATLAQWLSPGSQPAGKDDASRKNPFLNSQVVPAPGTQIVYWSVTDPDGDNVSYTFSIRPEESGTWMDVAVALRDSFTQFEIGHLPEGLYLTRLRVDEEAPRPAGQRLSYTFETDALMVDRTPPEIVAASAGRTASALRVSVDGRDARSLLEGVEFNFNNGVKEVVTQPDDGIRDGREERFVAEIPLAKSAGATSVEVILYDQSGNAVTSRVAIPAN